MIRILFETIRKAYQALVVILKRTFMSGLIVLLPTAITYWIASWIFKTIYNPADGWLSAKLKSINALSNSYIAEDTLIAIISKLSVIIVIICITIGIGIVAQGYIIGRFVKFGEYLVSKIPILNKIYHASKEVIGTILGSRDDYFSKVVIVPYPNDKTYAIGLLVKESEQSFENITDEKLIPVFVPSTPNPTSGYVLLYPEKKITHTQMSIEEGFKFIISCGVITPSSVLTKKSSTDKIKKK
ncbi:DUF502 domain-containing protein [Chlamydiia bacterium]|nr:DUF502 domain-containing protein [Chlamydiia bacterium]